MLVYFTYISGSWKLLARYEINNQVMYTKMPYNLNTHCYRIYSNAYTSLWKEVYRVCIQQALPIFKTTKSGYINNFSKVCINPSYQDLHNACQEIKMLCLTETVSISCNEVTFLNNCYELHDIVWKSDNRWPNNVYYITS